MPGAVHFRDHDPRNFASLDDEFTLDRNVSFSDEFLILFIAATELLHFRLRCLIISCNQIEGKYTFSSLLPCSVN